MDVFYNRNHVHVQEAEEDQSSCMLCNRAKHRYQVQVHAQIRKLNTKIICDHIMPIFNRNTFSHSLLMLLHFFRFFDQMTKSTRLVLFLPYVRPGDAPDLACREVPISHFLLSGISIPFSILAKSDVFEFDARGDLHVIKVILCNNFSDNHNFILLQKHETGKDQCIHFRVDPE